MSGYIAMSRDWQEHDVFGNDEFSRRDAWAWIIAQAAWKPTASRIKGSKVDLARGELSYSVRFLAQKWRWSKSRVDRFIAVLREEGMIETRSKIGTVAGHSAGQGQSILTVCNYDKYQSPLKDERDNDEQKNGTTAGQQRDKEEEGNKGRKEEKVMPENSGSYAFFGQTIKLTPRHLNEWRRLFHSIPDIEAELSTIDDWWQSQSKDRRENWFLATKGMLNKRHQENLSARRDYDPDRITV